MAKRAFDHCSGDYARYRPAYPAEVEARLAELVPPSKGDGIGSGAPVVADVGAGTGIWSRQLAARGWRVVAIDPSAAMLAEISTGPPADPAMPIRRVRATAEATGLADGSVALVTCAQSFHWFNPPFALAEFARILAADGVLMLVWNNRVEEDPFVAAFHELIQTWNPRFDREYRQQDWAGKIHASGVFTPALYERFETTWSLPQEAFVGFTRSVSYIRNVLARTDRPKFEDRLRQLLRDHFETGECKIPMHTDTWWARRKPEG